MFSMQGVLDSSSRCWGFRRPLRASPPSKSMFALQHASLWHMDRRQASKNHGTAVGLFFGTQLQQHAKRTNWLAASNHPCSSTTIPARASSELCASATLTSNARYSTGHHKTGCWGVGNVPAGSRPRLARPKSLCLFASRVSLTLGNTEQSLKKQYLGFLEQTR